MGVLVAERRAQMILQCDYVMQPNVLSLVPQNFPLRPDIIITAVVGLFRGQPLD